MIVIILLTIVFALLILNLIQVSKFKRFFGTYKRIDEVLEKERMERTRTLNKQITKQREEMYARMEDERQRLRLEVEERRIKLDAEYSKQITQAQNDYVVLHENLKKEKERLTEEYKIKFHRIEEDKAIIQETLDELRCRQEKTIDIMKEQEKDESELDFHRIEFTTQEHSDIELLLEVEKRLHNKDVLRKLIYKTYVEASMNEMFSRLGIMTEPGIYKIENIKDKRVYIGQSTNVRNRLREHIKSALGISTIANQAVHQAMAEEGLENFTFYLIDDCDRDILNEREKYWIDFYKSNEWGYNRTRGGS